MALVVVQSQENSILLRTSGEFVWQKVSCVIHPLLCAAASEPRDGAKKHTGFVFMRRNTKYSGMLSLVLTSRICSNYFNAITFGHFWTVVTPASSTFHMFSSPNCPLFKTVLKLLKISHADLDRLDAFGFLRIVLDVCS